MKTTIKTIACALKITTVALMLLAATSGEASAQSKSSYSGGGSSSGGKGGGGVPELDPSSMMGALALLSGGVLMLTDKIRGK